jgi:hypothetical protein
MAPESESIESPKRGEKFLKKRPRAVLTNRTTIERRSPKLWNARDLSLSFDRLAQRGSLAHPAPVADSGKKKPRRSKARALVDRLRDYRDECLAFLFDFTQRVPGSLH